MKTIIDIRPYQVLGIDDDFPEEIRFFMPTAQGAGSLLSLESLILIKLMRIIKPNYLFEFGTYKGLTTRMLLANLTPSDVVDERIFTLDLPYLDGINFQGTDGDLAKEALRFERKYLSESNKYLVKQLFQDSMDFDGSKYAGKFQFIFIDANHELNYVKRDTENSFKMISDDISCIVWHDYRNPMFPQLTQYIDNLATEIEIFHIENTKIAFHPRKFQITPRNLL
jgi:hypothetical protein